MPRIIKTKPRIKTVFPMGIVRPDGSKFKRQYKSMNMMKKMRKYYKGKGFKTRAI